MRLSIEASDPAEARSALIRAADWLDAPALWGLKSVVTELVTLCQLHGAWEAIPVQIDVSDREVKGVVKCPGAAESLYEARKGKKSFAVKIIAAFTSDWGADPNRGVIWFNMTLPSGI